MRLKCTVLLLVVFASLLNALGQNINIQYLKPIKQSKLCGNDGGCWPTAGKYKSKIWPLVYLTEGVSTLLGTYYDKDNTAFNSEVCIKLKPEDYTDLVITTLTADVKEKDTSNFKSKIAGDLVKVLSSLDLPSDLKADLDAEIKKGLTQAGTANIQFEYHIAQLKKDAIKERKEKCIFPSGISNGRRLVEGIGYAKLSSSYTSTTIQNILRNFELTPKFLSLSAELKARYSASKVTVLKITIDAYPYAIFHSYDIKG